MTYFASSRLARCGLKWELKHWKGILKNPDEYQKENDLEPLSWEDISGLLKDAGYNGTFDTKGERTTAAEHLVAFFNGLTPNQLDELLYPRKQREK